MKVDSPFGPAVESVPLPRSPLAVVVAQVRFPLVAAIAEQQFIAPFQERIRSTYSDLKAEMETQVTFTPDGVQVKEGSRVWRFTESDGPWEVTLSSEFLALSTRSYTNRHDFLTRLGVLLAALAEWIGPRTVRRFGVRYIDRVIESEATRETMTKLVRPEVLGTTAVELPDSVGLNHSLTECEYQFEEDPPSSLRTKWGFLPANATFDPAVEPANEDSWVLDVDCSHNERPFDSEAILSAGRSYTDRIYRFFRWAVKEEFLTHFGATQS
jgi:uncharacterized protein (TIGR04255 family)